jgi:hypothetical protein
MSSLIQLSSRSKKRHICTATHSNLKFNLLFRIYFSTSIRISANVAADQMNRLWTLHCRRPVWSLSRSPPSLYSRALQHHAQDHPSQVPDIFPLEASGDGQDFLAQRRKEYEKLRRAAQLEVKWLNESGKVSLAQRVQKLLQQDEQALATEITRQASKKKNQTTVCYNHLIRHALNQHPPRVNYAWLLFNEVCLPLPQAMSASLTFAR